MTVHHKPTQEECDQIRAWALRCIRKGRCEIEAGSRYNTEDSNKPVDINLRLVSDHEDWHDTDLNDHVSWAEFKKLGFDFAEGGRAEIDFYISSVGSYGELETNVQAIWEGYELVRLEDTSCAPLILKEMK